MKDHERGMLVDAISEAVLQTRRAIILKKTAIFLAICLGLSILGNIALLIWR